MKRESKEHQLLKYYYNLKSAGGQGKSWFMLLFYNTRNTRNTRKSHFFAVISATTDTIIHGSAIKSRFILVVFRGFPWFCVVLCGFCREKCCEKTTGGGGESRLITCSYMQTAERVVLNIKKPNSTSNP